MELSDKWDDYYYIEVWNRNDVQGKYFVTYLPYHFKDGVEALKLTLDLDALFTPYFHILKRKKPEYEV